MDFAWAINALKAGQKVTRKVWDGDPSYIELTAPGSNSIIAVGDDTQVENWLCLHSDIFADDWEEYKAGSMENCETLSNAINQLLDKVNKMPQLHATVQPGPNDKELTVTIVEEEPDERIAVTLNVTEVCREAIGCTISNPDGITKSSIGSYGLNDKVEG